MHDRKDEEKEFSLKDYFVPFNTIKAIHFIAIIGFIVYCNALFNGFVWDDLGNIIFNPQIQTFSLENIFGNDLINIGLQFRPVVTFYFSSLYALFKDAPFFYHLLNIVFHIINSILVLILLKKFFSIKLSFFLALIFLVHPMQVESATWISTAGNLYFLFGIIALLLAMKKNVGKYSGVGISILLLFSLLSKETGIVFIFMILAYYVLYKRKQPKVWILSISVCIFYLFLRLGIAQINFDAPSQIVPIASLPFGQRLITIPAIISYYFHTFFFPLNLVVMQYWVITDINFYNFIFPLLIIVVAFFVSVAIGFYLFKRNKKIFTSYCFFYFWLLIGLALHIQITPLNMTVADRWFYFPMVGLLGLIGFIIQYFDKLFKNNKALSSLFLLLSVVILFSLSIRTVIRNIDWRNDLTLYLHDRQILTNFSIENNIGWNYQRANNFKEANIYYKNSVALKPDYAISLNNLAKSYIELGDKERGKSYFYKILQAHDYYPELYDRDLTYTASLFNKYYPPEVARDFILKALKKNPNNGQLWGHLAIAEYNLKNQDKAIYAADKAKTLSNSKDLANLYILINEKKSLSGIKF